MLSNNKREVKCQKCYDVCSCRFASETPGLACSVKEQNQLDYGKENIEENLKILTFKNDRSIKNDLESWSKSEIEKLFHLYDNYGSQWKVLSEIMPSRTANNLKNRFYTVLRNLIKLLFREKENVCPKPSGEIPSKDLSRLYDGKENYKKFTGFVRKLLQQIDYTIVQENIEILSKKYSSEIIDIYRTIYGDEVLSLKKHFIAHKRPKQCEIKNSNKNPTKFICNNFEYSPAGPVNNETCNLYPSPPENQNLCYYFYYYPSNFFMSG